MQPSKASEPSGLKSPIFFKAEREDSERTFFKVPLQ